MTNHWIDFKNSDCILIMGANPASNHPVSFRWVLKAKERGATVICVDPRFTQSASAADIYAPLRSGTDIAFLGGMIRHLLEKGLIHKDYVLHYTNASFLIKEEYYFDDVAGVFAGYDKGARKYAKEAWQYQMEANGEPAKDPTLQNPKCVYQLLRKHYERYTPERVSDITGSPIIDLLRVYVAFGRTSAPDKAGTILYAMGWTQHTAGTQNIRAMAVIQLLLGNMGRVGGGVNALRGESNVQGSTDHGLLFHILPGYLKIPNASHSSLEVFNAKTTPKTIGKLSANWWQNTPKYAVSFLKSMYGAAAVKENDFGYAWLPKIDDGANHSWLAIFDAMYKGDIRGFFAWGMNPACSGANAKKVRQSLTKLDWLVNVNLFPNETGWFFQDKDLRDVETDKPILPKDIKTEVFVLPCAASVEKEGSISNSGRWMQWRYKAADAPGDARPDADIMNLIFLELRKLYAAEGGKCSEPILNVKWDYFDKHGEFNPHALAKDVNGYFLEDVKVGEQTFKKGQLVPGFANLQADGTTSSGCWIYCGSYTDKGNMAARRKREAPGGLGMHPEWSWCWPVNRRVIYNRASVDLQGNPWDAARPTLAWKDGKWVGDVPDGAWPPMAVDPEKTKYPFIMCNEGHGRLFTVDLADGPFPEHYEPLESPLSKNPFNGQMLNPAAKLWKGPADKCSDCGSKEFPYVCSTYRVTEHWQTGVMTRHAPWLLEMQPQLFVEMSRELAREKGIKAGDQVRVCSKRGAITAIALPTARLRPFTVMGQTVHQVGLPWCFGWKMPENGSGGDSANLLTPNVGDANTMIPESKAFLVDVNKLDTARYPQSAL